MLRSARSCFRPATFPKLSRGLYSSKQTRASQNDSFSSIEDVERFISGCGPRFSMHGSAVDILTSPSQFYSTLLNGTKTAQSRVVLSCLYLGNGELEQGLVDSLLQNPHIAVGRCTAHVLLDGTRGTRGIKNSVTMLLPLRQQYPLHTRVSLYHSPDLRGILRRAPSPFNEVIGLNHLKIFCFDDTLILSGANLSHDYFTSREDRYFLFRHAALANFFVDLVSVVGAFSLQSEPDGSFSHRQGYHPFFDDKRRFKDSLRAGILDLLARYGDNAAQEGCGKDEHVQYTGNTDSAVGAANGDLCGQTRNTDSKTGSSSASPTTAVPPALPDTHVFPLLQMGPYGIRRDFTLTRALFAGLGSGWHVHLASGYFNLVEEYVNALLSSSSYWDILTASPRANSFFGARGVIGRIPKAYTYIETEFLWRLKRATREHVRLLEYFREGWTFHVKGLWAARRACNGERVYESSQNRSSLVASADNRPCLQNARRLLPSLTLIGSPNFGYRSVHRDLEAQV